MSIRMVLFTCTTLFAGALALVIGSFRLNDYIRLPISFASQQEASDGRSASSLAAPDNTEIRVLTYDPLIVHFTDLVSPEERAYLIELAQPLLHKSTILIDGENVENEARTSSSAYLPGNDTIVKRIADRVHKFHGYMEVERIDMQVTSYQEGQQYVPHFDWYQEPGRTTNRFSTIFATLDAECKDCGTNFPELRIDWSARDSIWCKWFDCTRDFLTTKNIAGGGLFWRNLDENFEGRFDVLHAGMPATGGHKIGLNIWTEIRIPTIEVHEDDQETHNVSTLWDEYDIQSEL